MSLNLRFSERRTSLNTWLARIGVTIAVLCLLAMIFSGFGYQLGLWHFRTGFTIIRWSFYGALGAVVISLLGLVNPRAWNGHTVLMAVLGIGIGLGTAYVPWSWKQTLDAHPYIHDITTDVVNPPEFVATRALRKEGENPADYAGPEVAQQQQEAYPDLMPMVTDVPPAEVFEKAQAAIGKMGLELVDADPQSGRIEATDTSFFYGFKDDMVVRIVPAPEGTRVDVRSKSRVGRSDLGQNAKRIRKFFEELDAALAG
jgi:uncharacterized protein (DUF1499 family)